MTKSDLAAAQDEAFLALHRRLLGLYRRAQGECPSAVSIAILEGDAGLNPFAGGYGLYAKIANAVELILPRLGLASGWRIASDAHASLHDANHRTLISCSQPAPYGKETAINRTGHTALRDALLHHLDPGEKIQAPLDERADRFMSAHESMAGRAFLRRLFKDAAKPWQKSLYRQTSAPAVVFERQPGCIMIWEASFQQRLHLRILDVFAGPEQVVMARLPDPPALDEAEAAMLVRARHEVVWLTGEDGERSKRALDGLRDKGLIHAVARRERGPIGRYHSGYAAHGSPASLALLETVLTL